MQTGTAWGIVVGKRASLLYLTIRHKVRKTKNGVHRNVCKVHGHDHI